MIKIHQRGLAAHLAVAQRLVEKGHEVLQPLSDHIRYDLAWYEENPPKFVKVECKAGRLSQDESYFTFNAFNVNGSTRIKRGYRGDVEYFGVYIEETRKVYLIPVKDIRHTSEAHIRLKKPRNNQEKGILWADSYEL